MRRILILVGNKQLVWQTLES